MLTYRFALAVIVLVVTHQENPKHQHTNLAVNRALKSLFRDYTGYKQVTTRQTYTLTGIEGTLASEGGKLTFREQDGIDYAASTVPTQTPPTHTDSVRPIQIFWGSSLSCTLFGPTN